MITPLTYHILIVKPTPTPAGPLSIDVGGRRVDLGPIEVPDNSIAIASTRVW